jgi:hypothetical protein
MNYDVDPKNMSPEEIDQWLLECRQEISDAFFADDIAKAEKLRTMYDMVKTIRNTPNIKNETFRSYLSRFMLLEDAVNQAMEEVPFFEIGEIYENLKSKLTDCKVELDSQAVFDENSALVELKPITISVKFKLEYITDELEIKIVFTPIDQPPEFNIDDVGRKTYKTLGFDDNNNLTVKFLKLSGTDDCVIDANADIAEDLMFNTEITWPFSVEIDAAGNKKKLSKAVGIDGKIIALLGAQKLINSTEGYKSIRQSGSNQATRAAKKEAEKIRLTGGKSEAEQFLDMLTKIPGVNKVTVNDIPQNDIDPDRFEKKYAVSTDGGIFTAFFRISKETKKPIYGIKAGTSFGNVLKYYDKESFTKAVTGLIEKIKMRRMNPMQRVLVNRNNNADANRNINGTYNAFITYAKETLNGMGTLTKSELQRMYDKLLGAGRALTDDQNDTIADYAEKLGLE